MTDYARDKRVKAMDEGSRRNVGFVQWDADQCEIVGNVSKVSLAFSSVDISINVIDKIVKYQ